MPESAKAVSEGVYENLHFQQQGPVIPPGTSDVPRRLAGPRAESRRITGHVCWHPEAGQEKKMLRTETLEMKFFWRNSIFKK